MGREDKDKDSGRRSLTLSHYLSDDENKMGKMTLGRITIWAEQEMKNFASGSLLAQYFLGSLLQFVIPIKR